MKKIKRQDSSDDEEAPVKNDPKEAKNLVTDKELLARFYGSDDKLDP